MYIAVQEDSVVSLVSNSHSEDCVRTRLRKVVRSGRGRKRLLVDVVQPWKERGAFELPIGS